MKRLIALLSLMISSNVYAQQPRPPVPPEVEAERLRIQAEERHRQEMEQRDWETKIFQLKYADPRQLQQVLSMFRAAIQDNRDMRVLSVRAPREIMPAIEDAIKRFDVPSTPKTVDLTIYVLLASDQPDASKPVPQVLQPVITQLKNVFSYKGFHVMDTMTVRGMDGRGTNVSGTLPPFVTAGQTSDYSFNARFRVDSPDQKEPVLQLSDMRFAANVPVVAPGGFRLASVVIQTDVDVPRGQQVVVGKATVGESALILVMSAKF